MYLEYSGTANLDTDDRDEFYLQSFLVPTGLEIVGDGVWVFVTLFVGARGRAARTPAVSDETLTNSGLLVVHAKCVCLCLTRWLDKLS